MIKNYLIAFQAFLCCGSIMAQTECLLFTETYGDVMGDTKDITKRVSCHYDNEGKLVKRLENSFNLDGSMAPYYDYTYVYGESGLLEKEISKQRRYDGTWGSGRYVIYSYNDAGKQTRLLDEYNGYEYLYEWDGDNLVKSEKNYVYLDGTKLLVENFVYSDFVEGFTNKPLKVVAGGKYESDMYYGIYTYRQDGQIDTYKTFKTKNDHAIQEHIYNYDEFNRCTEYLRKDSVYTIVDDEEVRSLEPTCKTTYTYEDGKKVYKSYTYMPSTGKWDSLPIHNKDSVGIINVTDAPFDLKLTNASTSEQPNSVEISWTVNVKEGVDESWIIRRDGNVIDTVYSANKNAGTHSLSYVDKQIQTGAHEYCISYYVDGKDTYLMTETAFIDVYTAISAVTNIRYVSSRKETIKDPQNGNSYDATMVTLRWDAPVSDIDPLYYEIAVDFKSMIVKTDIRETEAEFSIGLSDEAMVWITAVYSTGSMTSTAYEVVATGIIPVKGTDLKIVKNNDKLIFNVKCSAIKVFDINGKEVTKAFAVSEIDTANLASGTYIVYIESEFGTRSIKFVK